MESFCDQFYKEKFNEKRHRNILRQGVRYKPQSPHKALHFENVQKSTLFSVQTLPVPDPLVTSPSPTIMMTPPPLALAEASPAAGPGSATVTVG